MSEEIQDINIDETPQVEEQVIDQADLEPTQSSEEPEWTAKFEGFEESKEVAPAEPTPAPEPEVESVEEIPSDIEKVDEPAQEEIKDIVPEGEEVTDTPVQEAEAEVQEEKSTLPEDAPEWMKKAYDFHKDTGGSLDDFVKVNKDYTTLDEDTLLKSYLQAKNPDFTPEEIEWEMEDLFGIDEGLDEESREYRKALLNKKRALSDAGQYFQDLQGKYVTDLKAGNINVPSEYKEAYQQVQQQQAQQKQSEQWRADFMEQTDKVFSDDFKGFDFDTGEGRYRIREGNTNAIKDSQMDLNTFTKEFLDDNGALKDVQGYHKALYAAKNADKIAKHFYQQGKADAIKERAKTTKNIDMKAKSHETKHDGGVKVNFIPPKGFGI